MAYNLWKFFGLQRSGNHAVINWLMGLDQENTLFFNKRKPGTDIFDDPSGVSMPDGHKSYAIRVSGKKVINKEIVENFRNRNSDWNLLVSFENRDMEKFDGELLNHPIKNSFGSPKENINFLILRNPFNLVSSSEKTLRSRIKKLRKKKMNFIERITITDDKLIERLINNKISMWKSYAFLCLYPNSLTRGNFIPIIFDKWIENREYRNQIAESIGYENMDKFIDFVSDAGKGSSFEGMQIKDNNSVLSRWDQGNKDLCKKIIFRHPDVIDYTALIFGDRAIPKDI